MKKNRPKLGAGIIFTAMFVPRLFSFHIDNLKTAYNKPIDHALLHHHAQRLFNPVDAPLKQEFIATSPQALLQAAKDTLYYLRNKRGVYRQVLEPYQFKHMLPLNHVEETLKFIIKTIEEDRAAGVKKYRIQDPDFLNQHFTFIRWKADVQAAKNNDIQLPSNGNIRLTNYVVYSVTGSLRKTKEHLCPLYYLLDHAIASKFTKQHILGGVFEKTTYRKKVKPLVWLSRNDFEEALMQGSTLVRMPDNTYKIFKVHICNGIPYDKRIKNPRQQKRYWYFCEGDNSPKAIKTFQEQLQTRRKVVFAGDVHNIGVGKVIAIRHINPIKKREEVRLGILADTGGAFNNNLYQLDYFLGLYDNKEKLKKQQMKLPNNTQAFLLCKKA